MNKTALFGILIALLLPLSGYFIVKGFSDRKVQMPKHYIYDSTIEKTVDGKQIVDTVWHKIPDFTFTNQLGQQVGTKELEGKIIVADFFFTHCPTICPQLTTNMKKIQDGISNGQKVGDRQAQYVHFLSFSVDPERDSVQRLKQWADRFQIDPQNWWLLTGDKKEIYDLSIEHMKLGLIDGKGIDTNFLHTDFMVLMDKERNIRGYYHGLRNEDMERLSRDIVLLYLEKDSKRRFKFMEGKLELLALTILATILGIGILVYFFKKDKKDGVDVK